MNKLTIDEVSLQNKRVLMRVDFNVPLDGGKVTDDTRIRAALPSIHKVLKSGGKLILMSHLGRPKGQRAEKYSLKPAAEQLSQLLGKSVTLAPDCVGTETEDLVGKMQNGDVVVLENLRFHAEEEANDAEFARKLAALADVYINDAFGAAHRAHASTEGVTHIISQSAAGYLMEKELRSLGTLLADPARPFIAIIGGAKISGKIDVIRNLLPRVDAILVGGGMVYTFLRSKGLETGKSLVEEDKISVAQAVYDFLGSVQNRNNAELVLPDDHVVAASIDAAAGKNVEEIPADLLGVDIGPKAIARYQGLIASARTIFWNGPMGVFENGAFAKGTMSVAAAVAKATDNGGFSVVGGGDSVSALMKSGLSGHISHISTGGGASLEFMSGKALPGVEALTPAS
ncbi:phosphoglycerate kinase [candidate division KSB1 bacterium]|nr:phosphoglycerate kinase [candidate division KSB1 bacterium]